MIEFIGLKAQQALIKEKIDAGIQRVLGHGQYILGPEVSELEEKLAAFVGAKYCISVANGTDALQIAQMALGIGPGDEVITPGFTYIATAETVALLGAKPVYVDVDPRTYNLDPALLEALARLATPAADQPPADALPTEPEPAAPVPPTAQAPQATVAEGDITDDEFEQLLDALHGPAGEAESIARDYVRRCSREALVGLLTLRRKKYLTNKMKKSAAEGFLRSDTPWGRKA